MPIAVTCPNCSSPCSVADSVAGQSVACPRCKKPFRVGSATRGTLPSGAGATVGPSAAAAPTIASGSPTVIGRYEVRQKLGAGAFGAVYRAHDPQLDRDVALKLLKPEALSSASAVERFRREARAAAKMLHANIVPVHDYGEHEGAGYLASAFIEGKSLSQCIPDGGMEPRTAVKLTIQLLDALAYAHEQGVMHRDVKPANCLVDGKGRLYLTDFGLAGSLQEAATRMTRIGAVMGTPAYMAPEQAAGATTQVGPHSDQYGAGVVLYELLTGNVPFAGPVDVVLFNVIRTEPPAPSSLRPGIDKSLEAICLEAMAKKPGDRFASATAFATALRGWLAASKMQTSTPAGKTQTSARASETRTSAPAARTQASAAASETQTSAKQESTKVRRASQPAARDDQPTRTQADEPPSAPLVRKPAPPRRTTRWRGLAIASCLLVAAGGAALAFTMFGGKNTTHDERRAEDTRPDKDGPDSKLPDNHEPDTKKNDKKEPPSKDDRKARPLSEAERTWLTAAEKGDAIAQYSLGNAYYHGEKGLEIDYREAVRWLRRSHDQGNVDATTFLGRCYAEGRGVEVDFAQAMRLLLEAHKTGSTWAARHVGLLHAYGQGVKVDHAEAARWYRLSADRGDDYARHLLADCYAKGRGVDRDLATARTLWEKAAANGSPDAKKALADLAKASKEPSEDVRKLLADAQKGDVKAQYELARAHYYGEKGLKVDYADAVRWFRAAEKQGHADSTAFLGYCYNSGLSVKRDDAEAMRLFLKAHKDGCTWAARQIGYLYEAGLGVPVDPETAVQWFRLSADKDDDMALYSLGKCYAEGRGVTRDLTKAKELWEKAAAKGHEDAKKALADLAKKKKEPCEAERKWRADAEKGDASAQANLGCAYAFGMEGARIDLAEGVKWLKKAVEQGEFHAQANLANLYYSGEGVERDTKKAVDLWKLAAAKKHPVALTGLGHCYESGVEVAVDLEKAASLYRDAAEQKWPRAQFCLSKLYREGRGVKKDVAEADRLLKLAADGGDELAKADLAKLQRKEVEQPSDQVKRWRQDAEKGDARAQGSLGFALIHGKYGVKEDLAEGVKWLKKAAEQGDDRAQTSLGLLYATGRGVEQDVAESVRLYKLAVARNNPTAMSNLAGCYKNGKGVPRDLAEAVRLYREAVKLNSPRAQYRLSVLHREGVGVKQDVAEADRLLKLAADGGDELAKADLAKSKEK